MKKILIKVYLYFIYPLAILVHRKNNSKFSILSDEETIKKIINEKMSIARFGDGEFNGILGRKPAGFQEKDLDLTQRLKEIIKSNNKDIMLGIPKGLVDVSEYSQIAKKFWRIYTCINRKKLFPHFGDREFVNTNFTRPYIDYKDKRKSQDKFNAISKIWEDKNIVIIEGINTKFGVGNDLMNNTQSVKRILCPSNNAFDSYEIIFNAILKNVSPSNLILISLGPTATVLAYDLSKKGYQAIDLGHLDVEYEWYLQGADKIPLKGKKVNEAIGDLSTFEITDMKYEESIIIDLVK